MKQKDSVSYGAGGYTGKTIYSSEASRRFVVRKYDATNLRWVDVSTILSAPEAERVLAQKMRDAAQVALASLGCARHTFSGFSEPRLSYEYKVFPVDSSRPTNPRENAFEASIYDWSGDD